MADNPRITTDLDEVLQELNEGRLVSVPTETVYGLAADATQPSAVSRVFQLKGRPVDHPLIVHCASADQAWQCAAQVTQAARELAAAFWPGPLTLVLPRAASISTSITAGQDSVAIRVPNHPLTLQLLQRFQRPLVAPSANRFGRVSPTTAQHVQDEFPNSRLLILDGGPCQVGIESTIIDCRSPDGIRILRPGKIAWEDLCQVLGDVGLPSKEGTGSEPVRVSGDLPAHYAPLARVHLVERENFMDYFRDLEMPANSTLAISTLDRPAHLPTDICWQKISPQPEEFARKMYALFRDADRQGVTDLIVELPSSVGIGVAIRDRLQRAAYRRD